MSLAISPLQAVFVGREPSPGTEAACRSLPEAWPLLIGFGVFRIVSLSRPLGGPRWMNSAQPTPDSGQRETIDWHMRVTSQAL